MISEKSELPLSETNNSLESIGNILPITEAESHIEETFIRYKKVIERLSTAPDLRSLLLIEIKPVPL